MEERIEEGKKEGEWAKERSKGEKREENRY